MIPPASDWREHVDHPHDHQRGLLGDGHLRAKSRRLDEVLDDFVSLAEFLDRLGDPVERPGKRLDVLAVERGDEDFHQFLADDFRVLFLVAAGDGEFREGDVALRFVEQPGECLDALVRGFRAGGEEFKEPVRFSKELGE